MININRGHNKKLMDTCRTLRDYAEYTARVREYAGKLPLEEAVERAITECIKEGILSDFLSKNRAEAKSVSIYEYDEERHMRQTREEGYEEGRAEGEERFAKLMMILLHAKRMEDLGRVARDVSYRKQLYQEFHITEDLENK